MLFQLCVVLYHSESLSCQQFPAVRVVDWSLKAIGLVDNVDSSCAWIDQLSVSFYGPWRVYSDSLPGRWWESVVALPHLHRQPPGCLPAFSCHPTESSPLVLLTPVLGCLIPGTSFLTGLSPTQGPPNNPRRGVNCFFPFGPKNCSYIDWIFIRDHRTYKTASLSIRIFNKT